MLSSTIYLILFGLGITIASGYGAFLAWGYFKETTTAIIGAWVILAGLYKLAIDKLFEIWQILRKEHVDRLMIENAKQEAKEHTQDIPEKPIIFDELDGFNKVIPLACDQLDETPLKATDELLKQPDALTYLRAYAIQAAKDQKWQEALVFWERVLEDEPEDSKVFFNAALSLFYILTRYNENNLLWAKAFGYFRKSIELDPDDLFAKIYFAIMLDRRGSAITGEERDILWKEASENYRKAIECEPDLEFVYSGLAHLLVKQGYMATGKKRDALWKEALEYFHKCTELNPDNYSIWFSIAALLLKQSVVAPEAVREALWEEVLEYYRKTIESKPANSYMLWIVWGNLLIKHSDAVAGDARGALWKEILKCFRKVTEIEPTFHVTWKILADFLDKQLNVAKEADKESLQKEADEARQRAIDLDPSLKDDAKPDDNQK